MSDPERREPEAATTTHDAAPGDVPADAPGRPGDDAPPQADTGPARARRPWLAIVALLVALLVGIGAYLAWQDLRARLASAADAQGALDGRLTAAQAASTSTGAALDARLTELATGLAGQQEALERQRELAEQTYLALREEVGQDRNRWIVAEIEYLMRVAAHRLALAGDVPAAIAALQAADGRLNDLADPTWLDVREQVADEIAALRAVPRVDVEGLALALRSLAKRAETLPVLGARYRAGDPRAADPAAGSDAGARGENWREALDVAWRELRQLVEVRRNDQPVEPMLAPELEYFLYQNLRLQLDAARLAVLRGEGPLYVESLRSARDWAATYFDPEHTATQAMVAELDRLLAVELAPPLPEVGGALRALRASPAYRQARGGDS